MFGDLIMKESILKSLSHGKQYTRPLYRMSRAGYHGYTLQTFFKFLLDMEKSGLIVYNEETEYSLAYWDIKEQ